MSFSFAGAKDLLHVVTLLRRCGLPHEDIHRHLSGLIVAKEGDRLIGTVALELYSDAALLRSLAVADLSRKRGVATALLERAIDYAHSNRIEQLFLLTTSAQGFFTKRGFQIFDRSGVPAPISATEEFRSLCPSEALCMRKAL